MRSERLGKTFSLQIVAEKVTTSVPVTSLYHLNKEVLNTPATLQVFVGFNYCLEK